MADEEKTTVELNEGDDKAESKKGGNKMLLFGGIGLVVVIVGVVLALFVVMPMMSDKSADSDTEQVEESDEADSYDESDEDSDDGHGGDKSSGGGLTAAIKEIVVNPAGTSGSRYLSVSFGFEFSSAKVKSRFEAKELMVRDALISILSSKTVTQLTDAKQKEIMRYQIKKRLSQLLKTNKLKAVYYTDFVLQ